MIEKPNWGQIDYYQYPASVKVTANDAFDGTKMNYFNVACARFGSCVMNVWAIKTGAVTTFPLSCVANNGVLSGLLMVSPSDPNTVIGVHFDSQDNYKVVSINVQAKTCTLSGVLSNLPAAPRIVVSSQIGYKSGNLVLSVAANGYSMVIVYNPTFQYLNSVKMAELAEDIFVDEV